ncbi:MAG: CHAD domain-containing protein, partial [Undibacterium sp.]|nr:CHAD domain-containing protein [Undibacterium sp.]
MMNIAKPNRQERRIKHGANAVTPAPLILSKRMSVEQSFQIIVFNCLGQIEANAANMIEKYDVESLHQMRVGLRRLRSATNLFDTILTLPDFLQEELNWLGTQLGAARDWDVFTTSTLPTLIGAYTGTPGDKKKLQQVMLAALDVAYEKHQTVLVTIRSKRYARLIAYGNTWVDGCEWRNGMPKKEKSRLTRRIKKFARELIRRKQRRLRKRLRQWQESDQQTLHRLRIAVKKLRYAATFFSSLTTS